jgi:predicted transcriptional regulator
LVNERPGVTIPELARALEVGRAAARFHLDVLRRAHAVDVVRRGRQQFVFPNSGAYSFAVGQNARASDIMALMRDPIRATIGGLLADRMLTPAEIRREWPGSAPSRSLLAYHLQQLSAAGIIGRGPSSEAYRLIINTGSLLSQNRA